MISSQTNPYIDEIHEHKDIVWLANQEENFKLDSFQNPQRRLVLDLGCGAGNFLRDYAQVEPETNFVGFEVRYKRLVKGAEKFKKKGLENVRLVQGRAEGITEVFQSQSVHEININFPDPWAKRKQLKHRLINQDYLKKIHSLLVSGGHFVFKTDHQGYFAMVAGLLQQQSDLKLIEYSENLHHSEFDEKNIPTEFELLFKYKDCPVYYLKTQAC